MKNWVINSFLVISLIGLLDAGYLSLGVLIGGDTGCFLVKGCNIVLKSTYSEILGIPVAFLGLFYYLAIFVSVFVFNFNRNPKLQRVILWSTTIGFVSTLWFLYAQAFILRAFCSYCLISAITSVSLFGLSMYFFKKAPENFQKT
jgi:uncharacterized membrane protein